MATQDVPITTPQQVDQRKTQTEAEISRLRQSGDEAFAQSDYDEALRIYLRAADLASNADNPLILSIILASAANTYARLGNYDCAENYYRSATQTLSFANIRQEEPPVQLDKRGPIFVMIGVTLLWLLAMYRIGSAIYLTPDPSLLPLLEVANLLFLIVIFAFLIPMRKIQRKQQRS